MTSVLLMSGPRTDAAVVTQLMNFDDQNRQSSSWWHGLLARALQQAGSLFYLTALPNSLIKIHQAGTRVRAVRVDGMSLAVRSRGGVDTP